MVVDADLEMRVQCYGRRLYQLVVIPDTDVSNTENLSPDVLTANNQPHDTSSNEDEQVPLAKLKGKDYDEDDDAPLAQIQMQQLLNGDTAVSPFNSCCMCCDQEKRNEKCNRKEVIFC